jgi:hypothetical protein
MELLKLKQFYRNQGKSELQESNKHGKLFSLINKTRTSGTIFSDDDKERKRV